MSPTVRVGVPNAAPVDVPNGAGGCPQRGTNGTVGVPNGTVGVPNAAPTVRVGVPNAATTRHANGTVGVPNAATRHGR